MLRASFFACQHIARLPRARKIWGNHIMRFLLAFLALSLASSPVCAKAVKIIQPLAAGVAGANHVIETRVALNELTRAKFAKLEEKAAGKRVAAGLAPVDPAAPVAARPVADEYATLPIAQMMPLVVEDELAGWGLTGGRAVKLLIELDTLKTADAAMAILFSSTDQLAGVVTVTDAATGETLGQFYVDVLNARGGMLGLAMRGSGVREKLAAEFAKRVGQTLSGSKSRPKVRA